MIPLPSAELPRDGRRLAEFLRAGLSDLVEPSAGAPQVSLDGDPEQGLSSLRIDLTGTTLKEADPLLRPDAVAEEEAVLPVETLAIRAEPMQAFGAAVHLALEARDVQFGRVGLSSGTVMLVPTHLESGTLALSVSREELTRAARARVRELLARDGIELQGLELALEARGERTLAAEVTVKARKFISATVRMSGLLSVDEGLEVVVSDLKGAAEGVLSSLLGPVLDRLSRRFEGRRFSLARGFLASIRLRELHLGAGPGLEVRAELAGK